MKNNNLIEYSIISILPILTYLFWGIFVDFFSPLVPLKDAANYSLMAKFPFSPEVSAPFCYRILTPFIAYCLPFDTFTSFFYLNLVFFSLTAVILYFFFKKLHFNRTYSFLGEFIFVVGSITNIYLIHNYIMVDHLNQFLFLIGCYILLNKSKSKDKDISLILLLMLGVLNKETILLLIPIYFIMVEDKLKNKIYRTLLVSAPAILIYFCLRLIPCTGTYEGSWLLFHLENLPSTFYNIFLAFGPFWILAFFNFENKNRFLRRSYWIIPVFIAQIIFASNIYRLIFLAFPIIIPLGLIELKHYHQRINKYSVFFIILAQTTITVFYILKKYLGFDFLNIVYFPLIAITIILLIIISGIFYFKSRISA
jgi:hypothetical protein